MNANDAQIAEDLSMIKELAVELKSLSDEEWVAHRDSTLTEYSADGRVDWAATRQAEIRDLNKRLQRVIWQRHGLGHDVDEGEGVESCEETRSPNYTPDPDLDNKRCPDCNGQGWYTLGRCIQTDELVIADCNCQIMP